MPCVRRISAEHRHEGTVAPKQLEATRYGEVRQHKARLVVLQVLLDLSLNQVKACGCWPPGPLLSQEDFALRLVTVNVLENIVVHLGRRVHLLVCVQLHVKPLHAHHYCGVRPELRSSVHVHSTSCDW